MLFLVFWWALAVLSLRSHSWKQTITFRSRFHPAKRGGHFCVLDTSFPTRLYATGSGAAKPLDGVSQPALVEVYSTLGCKYCKKAKATLDDLGVTYLTIDITPETGNADQMVEECAEDGMETRKEKVLRRQRIAHATSTTVPQIYVIPHRLTTSNTDDVDDDGDDDVVVRVGGCDDLLKEIEEGVFQSRLGLDKVGSSESGGVRIGVKDSVAVTTATVLSPPLITTSSTPTTPPLQSFATPITPPMSYLNHLGLVSDEKALSAEELALGSKRFDALTLSKALQTQVKD